MSLLKKRIERSWESAEIVSKKTGENPYKLFCEIIYNWFRWGASEEDFMTMEFYRLNSREKRRWLTSKKNNRYLPKKLYNPLVIETFDNKAVFDKKFSEYMSHEVMIANEHTLEEILNFAEKHKEVIIKPARGCLGYGVNKYKYNEEGKKNIVERISSKKELIVEEVIKQHPDMALLNPHSVNTIRVITMIDKKGEIHILSTLVKFGVGVACTSNTLTGGLCAHIDPVLGKIDTPAHSQYGEKFTVHPESGLFLLGFQIPNWNGLLEFAKKLATVMPEARYIGWDIVITENGYDVIEGNIHPAQEFQTGDGIGRWKEMKSYI